MDKQSAIILGVWRVILERGISGVSVRAVADAANVSVGLVQHYYRSKDLLIRASARAMVAGAADRYGEVSSTGESIRHLVTHAIPTSDRERDGVIVWHAYLAGCVADPVLAQILRDAKSGQERELATRLAETMPTPKAYVMARTVIALADGLAERVIMGNLTGSEAVEAALTALDELATPSAPTSTSRTRS